MAADNETGMYASVEEEGSDDMELRLDTAWAQALRGADADTMIEHIHKPPGVTQSLPIEDMQVLSVLMQSTLPSSPLGTEFSYIVTPGLASLQGSSKRHLRSMNRSLESFIHLRSNCFRCGNMTHVQNHCPLQFCTRCRDFGHSMTACTHHGGCGRGRNNGSREFGRSTSKSTRSADKRRIQRP
jgi:hypothetical protein